MSKRLKTEATTSNPRSNANSGSNSAARVKNPASGNRAPVARKQVTASGRTAGGPLKRRKGAVTKVTVATQTTDTESSTTSSSVDSDAEHPSTHPLTPDNDEPAVSQTVHPVRAGSDPDLQDPEPGLVEAASTAETDWQPQQEGEDEYFDDIDGTFVAPLPRLFQAHHNLAQNPPTDGGSGSNAAPDDDQLHLVEDGGRVEAKQTLLQSQPSGSTTFATRPDAVNANPLTASKREVTDYETTSQEEGGGGGSGSEPPESGDTPPGAPPPDRETDDDGNSEEEDIMTDKYLFDTSIPQNKEDAFWISEAFPSPRDIGGQFLPQGTLSDKHRSDLMARTGFEPWKDEDPSFAKYIIKLDGVPDPGKNGFRSHHLILCRSTEPKDITETTILSQNRRNSVTILRGAYDQSLQLLSSDMANPPYGRQLNDTEIGHIGEAIGSYVYELGRLKANYGRMRKFLRETSYEPLKESHQEMLRLHEDQIDELQSLLQKHSNLTDDAIDKYCQMSKGGGTSSQDPGYYIGKAKLPAIELPRWTGRPEDFSRWFHMYDEMYHSNRSAPISLKIAALEKALPEAEKKRLRQHRQGEQGYNAFIQELRDKNEKIEKEIQLKFKSRIQLLPVCATGSPDQYSPTEIYRRMREFLDNILECKSGFLNSSASPPLILDSDWYPPCNRKLQGVEALLWYSEQRQMRRNNQYPDDDEFGAFLGYLKERTEELRRSSESSLVQKDIERSRKTGGSSAGFFRNKSAPQPNRSGRNGGRHPASNNTSHVSHATSYSRKPNNISNSRKAEAKTNTYPSRCPFILQSGQICGQAHAGFNCDSTRWHKDKVWGVIYGQKLCPMCLCQGHLSKDCPRRNRGPCNRALKGGEKCTYYHHPKLCPIKFVPLREWQEKHGQNKNRKTAPSAESSFATKTSKENNKSKGKLSQSKGKKKNASKSQD